MDSHELVKWSCGNMNVISISSPGLGRLRVGGLASHKGSEKKGDAEALPRSGAEAVAALPWLAVVGTPKKCGMWWWSEDEWGRGGVRS